MQVNPSFDNTEIAFKAKTNGELRFAHFIFKILQNPALVSVLTSLTTFALKIHLPIEWAIKLTIFKQFCGGEKIKDCEGVYQLLRSNNIEAILDYSVEGQTKEEEFDHVRDELIRLVENATKNARVPTTCMKVTGIGRHEIFEAVSADKDLNEEQKLEYTRVINRLEAICRKAHELGVKIYIDAEESWIQKAIDRLTEVMMQKFNQQSAIVYITLQMYRHDRLSYMKELIEKTNKNNFKLGVKIVRGAYLEKENTRAEELDYLTPMQPTKMATDNDYNAAIKLAIENISVTEICAGTHNEQSILMLCNLMHENGIENNHPSIFFSQLFGMSDNISYNLAHNDYNVSKYLPYGPVRDTVPYLIRRAEENTSIAGQMGRELTLITKELKRRNS